MHGEEARFSLAVRSQLAVKTSHVSVGRNEATRMCNDAVFEKVHDSLMNLANDFAATFHPGVSSTAIFATLIVFLVAAMK